MQKKKQTNNRQFSNFGSWIRSIRLSNGMTQDQVAKSLGYETSQAIANVERGMSCLSGHRIALFCKKYKVDINDAIEKIMVDSRQEIQSKLSKLMDRV